MAEFLAENNVCGQTILLLVSNGNAILAEILRLKDYIPKVFRLDNKQDVQKYGEIIFDFYYFKMAEAQENKIENSEALSELDSEFRDNHLEIINRFYLAFESIHSYVSDLNDFLEELNDGLYIHQTVESIFTDLEGKQLLCEALYLYGLMLLLVDYHIEGIVRERLLVSYYRYTPQRRDTQSCIDEVCKLLRDTGLNSTKKPLNYPEDYFKRVAIKSNYIDIVIGRLRSDDIYGQISVYPLPKHRSCALASQAAMLYVCLFFSTNILHHQTAIMREIVDKYFPDNWIISIYMGHTVNLAENWDAFKAAKLALNNTLELVNIKEYAGLFGASLIELLKQSNLLLHEGRITSESLLKDITFITNTLRECNVTVRWLMLHTILPPGKVDKNKRLKMLRDQVVNESKCDQSLLFKLLLNTAQLEHTTKEIFKSLVNEKDKQWTELKTETHKSLLQLSEVFTGSKPLSRVQQNEDLVLWFREIAKEVDLLESDSSASSRKIVQLIQALEEVQEFHQLEADMQVVQFLVESRRFLDQMIRNMNIKEDVLVNLQIIGDVSYAWELIDFYTGFMQSGIKKDPTLVSKLRAVFLKLASALEVPLLRINQAHSEDLISVSQYYSRELEIYVRKVLQIIPHMMFEKMARIIYMQTSVLQELPTRVDKDRLKDLAQLDERFEFAELTHSVSVFSQGMRMMKTTLVGVVCLDPKQLLEDGIRKELVQHLSKVLNNELIFQQKNKLDEFGQRIESVARIMDGYKRSFEYIQDYININGLKIWQEEVTRIINYNVEQECNGFLRNKIHWWQSQHQSRYVPIPIFPQTDLFSVNFIGRLAREVIRLTDPRNSIYLRHSTSWNEIKSQKVLLNKETICSIANAIEVAGLVGLDRLFSFMIITNLQKLAGYLENKSAANAAWNTAISSISKELKLAEESSTPIKLYQNFVHRTSRIWSEFLENALVVGQLQLIRSLICFHLNTSCRFNAKNLEASLRTLNKTLLNDVKNDVNPSDKLLKTLSEYYDFAGLNDPYKKVYITSKNNPDYAVAIFMFVIAHLSKVFLPQSLEKGSLSRRTADQIDGTAFAVAVHTILKQFHCDINNEFIRLLSEFVIQITRTSGKPELQPEVVMVLNFLEIYTNFSEHSRQHFRQCLPKEILHVIQTLVPTV